MTFQILSLSGGGFLGLYTISVLAELERQVRRPIASCFDLLAGTSVGGIIAVGLAAEQPATDIKHAFESHGTRIFSDRPAPTNWLERCRDFSRSLFSPKYNGKALSETVIRIIGKHTLMGDLKRPVIVPSINLTKGKPQIFKTAHHPTFRRDHQLKVVDVALATSAAPTYFPVAEIGDELFADGGLYANSPDLVALHEAEYFFGVPTEQVRMLSIGTTTTQFSFSHVTGRQLGVWGWRQRFAQTMISSQQMDVGYILGHKLGDRYVRIDEVQSREQERDLGLDIATEDAQKTIRGMASGSVQAVLNDPMLGEILEYQAPEPTFHHLVAGAGEQKETH
jgi:uncharacterized protein